MRCAGNRRLRLRVWCDEIEDPVIDSLTGIWASADWFEREAFDLFADGGADEDGLDLLVPALGSGLTGMFGVGGIARQL